MGKNTVFSDDIKEIIIDEQELKDRISELGKEITDSYEKDDDIVMLCVLRGAILFMADLAREIDLPVVFDFMDV